MNDEHAGSARGTERPGDRVTAAAGLPSPVPSVPPLSSLTFLRQVADEVTVANDDSVDVIAGLTRTYLDASAAGLSVVDPESRALRIAALVPRAPANDSYVWQMLPLARRYPGGAAVLNAATYMLCTREEILGSFPSVVEYPVGDKAQALYCAPLIHRAEIVGTVFAAWDSEHCLSDEQRATMRVVAALAATVFDG